MIQAPPVQKAMASQSVCFSTLRQAMLRVIGWASRRMRSTLSPSIRRSTHMNRSVQTVCGQVKPHQRRPNRLVTRNSPTAHRIRNPVR